MHTNIQYAIILQICENYRSMLRRYGRIHAIYMTKSAEIRTDNLYAQSQRICISNTRPYPVVSLRSKYAVLHILYKYEKYV